MKRALLDTLIVFEDFILPDDSSFLNVTAAEGFGPIDITGNRGQNILTGNSDNNILDGGLGRDRLIGGAGNDTFLVDNLGDVVLEFAGEGIDTIVASAGALTTSVAPRFLSYSIADQQAIENLTIDINTTVNSSLSIYVIGNDANNHLTGHNGINTFSGGLGADTFQGMGGDDIYLIDSLDDTIIEAFGGGNNDRVSVDASKVHSYTLGSDVRVERLETSSVLSTDAINLFGNAFSTRIDGNNGANTLVGGSGNDTIIGNAGSDRLVGGLGVDILIGGDDKTIGDQTSDIYVFDTVLNGEVDILKDILTGSGDKIELHADVFQGIGPAGALDPDAFILANFAQDAEDRIIANFPAHLLSFDPDGTGSAPAIPFASIINTLSFITLQPSAFIIV